MWDESTDFCILDLKTTLVVSQLLKITFPKHLWWFKNLFSNGPWWIFFFFNCDLIILWESEAARVGSNDGYGSESALGLFPSSLPAGRSLISLLGSPTLAGQNLTQWAFAEEKAPSPRKTLSTWTLTAGEIGSGGSYGLRTSNMLLSAKDYSHSLAGETYFIWGECLGLQDLETAFQ